MFDRRSHWFLVGHVIFQNVLSLLPWKLFGNYIGSESLVQLWCNEMLIWEFDHAHGSCDPVHVSRNHVHGLCSFFARFRRAYFSRPSIRV